jgi:hypothetical protein
MKLIRFLFLIKEIISRAGEVHFRRYRLLQTPWFAVYLHQIKKSDEEKDPHDHPWKFWSFLLKGSYREWYIEPPSYLAMHRRTYKAGDLVHHPAEDAHQLTLITPEVWTLVFTSGRDRYWGYRLQDGGWIGHNEYRQLKNKERQNEEGTTV